MSVALEMWSEMASPSMIEDRKSARCECPLAIASATQLGRSAPDKNRGSLASMSERAFGQPLRRVEAKISSLCRSGPDSGMRRRMHSIWP